MARELDKFTKSQDKEHWFAEFQAMRPDLVNSEAWTPEQTEQAAELIRPSRTKTNMLAAIPMRCRGSLCIYAETCPLLAKNIAPVGSGCPIEMSMVMSFFEDYVEELSVDTDRMVEVSMVRDLVDQEIQQIRATKVLADEHFIQENVVGVDQEGNVVTKKELHTAVDYEDRILKRKEKLRNQLLATRESKAKIGQSQTDGAQVIANIMDDVRKLQVAREKELRLRLGIAEEDDYIEEADVVEDE